MRNVELEIIKNIRWMTFNLCFEMTLYERRRYSSQLFYAFHLLNYSNGFDSVKCQKLNKILRTGETNERVYTKNLPTSIQDKAIEIRSKNNREQQIPVF